MKDLGTYRANLKELFKHGMAHFKNRAASADFAVFAQIVTSFFLTLNNYISHDISWNVTILFFKQVLFI